jgi:amino acid adenylation domain-containing protein/thioester reductase-like protein
MPTAEEIRPRLRAILVDALSLDDMDVPDDRPFVELATSSLALVDAFRRISEAFRVRPSLRRIFEEHGTLERLAGYIAELAPSAPLLGAAEGPRPGPVTPEPGAELVAPLTAAQEQIRFLTDLRPEAAPAWHETVVVELGGAIDIEALRAALQALSDRHEGMRARLSPDGRALRVAARARIDLPVHDLSASPAAERGAHAGAWLREAMPLSPGEALWRIDLARLEPGTHLLRLTAHGLVADRPALLRMMEELGALYAAERTREDPRLPAPGSLVAHQREELARADDPGRGALVDFWRARLDRLPLVDLPADHERPKVKRYTGDRLVVPLDVAAVQRSRGDEGKIGAFFHMLAVVAAWCARLSGRDDLVIGAFARPLADTSALFASLGNALPLRLSVDPRAPFAELRRQARACFLDAVDHAALPFASLVQALNPERDQSRSAVFTIAVDRDVWPALRFGELSARVITGPCRHARYDLHFTLVEGPGLTHLQCDYATELFEAATLRRLMGHLRRLFEATIAEPALRVGALPLLAPDERTRIVDAWNQTGLEVPEDDSLLTLIRARAVERPGADAVVEGERRMSYGELIASSNRVANRLRALGVAAEARVAVFMERSIEAVVAMLGVLAAGGAYVPLDPEYPASRIAYTLEDSGAVAVLTDAALAASLPAHGRAVIPLSAGLPELAGVSDGDPGVPVHGDALAYLVYTSGSTGKPKGTAVEHRSAVNLVHWARTAFDDEELAAVLATTSFCFDLSVFEIFVPLSWGGCIVLGKTLLHLPALPARDRVTLINTVPSALSELLRMAELPASARVVNLAGEPLRRELTDRIHGRPGRVRRVLNLYGPSETTTYSTVATIAPGDPREPGIGRPIANTRIYVLDEQGEPVPPGVVGDLCIGGRGVARGYLGKPELTERSFVADPFVRGGRMYRTGDVARYLPDGALELLGRRDDQVKVRGFRVELGEIEVCLSRHPALREVAVMAREHADEGRRIVAWVVKNPEVLAVHAPDLRAYVREHLPAHMVPLCFVELPALPRLPNGKIDRVGLPEPDMARESRVATAYAPPSTELERSLAAIWARQLGVERVGVNDDFFELGGHSLLLAPIMLECSRRLGVRVSLGEFFEVPTVARLAARLLEISGAEIHRTLLRERILRTGPQVDAHFDALRRDAALDPALDGAGREGEIAREAREIFITGVTGFVGAHVFHELIRRSDARFHCLCRCADPAEGRRRIAAVMQQHGLWDEAMHARFEVVPGDLGRPRLGLDPATYERLSRGCDAVMHLAAFVNFIYPYRALRQINVGGVHEVIRLCFDGRLKPLHYMSTAAVWPMGAKHRFREDDDIDQGIRLNLGYDESKWVAEHLVIEARRRGLLATIYRPGEVSGHSVTGRCVLDHFMFAIMKGSIQMRLFPDVKCMMDMAPVDYVAASFAALSQLPASRGKTYHLNNPSPCRPDEILRIAHDYGYPFDLAPMQDWVATLLARDDLSENALYPFTAVLEEFEEENLQFPVYDTTNARAALAGTGVACPPVAAPLLDRYLDWFVEVGYLHPPERPRAAR